MFATFYPAATQESAFSLLATASASTPEYRVHHAVAIAFRRCSPLIYTMPCRLEEFCYLTQNAYGMPNDVLREHTLFNFFCCGLTPNLRIRLHNQLTSGTRSRTCAPRMSVFLECGNRFGLDCPECTRETQRQIGRRVSLCQFCIPFVTRCPLHQCKLVLVDECSKMEILARSQSTRESTANSLRFAEIGRYFSLIVSDMNCRATLIEMLKAKGYTNAAGHASLAKLCRDFCAFFSDGFEDRRLTILIERRTIPESVIRQLGREERAVHPVFMMLMHWFLTDSQGITRRSPAASRRDVEAIVTSALEGPLSCPDVSTIQLKRNAWITHVDRLHKISRTQTRLLVPALWIWLYRHDRRWLDAHQTVKRQPRRHKKNVALPDFLRTILSSYRDESGEQKNSPPLLQTAYQTRLRYGLNDYAFERSCAEIHGTGSKAQMPAAPQAFIAKRITWAKENLMRNGESLNEAVVARRACLRLETLRQHNKICHGNLTAQKK